MIGPHPSSTLVGETEKIRSLVTQQPLVGLANDTKWNELLLAMRRRTGWTPAFRFKRIDSGYVSRWDREWLHHVPMPFISVLWFEIEHSDFDHRLPRRRIDYTQEIATLLEDIGLDYEVRSEAIRIFGYAPRDHGE